MSNDKHTPTATDFFIYKIGEPPVTASEKLAVVLMTEYAESLRAEKAELIEALRRVRTYLVDNNDLLAPFPNRSEIDNIDHTLAKYETP